MDPIIKVIKINASASKVWEALIDPEKLGEWTGMPNNVKPHTGSEFILKGQCIGD